MMQIIIFILFVLFFALLSGFIARKRRANIPLWTFMGGLFGPFAIPFVFFANSRDRNHPDSEQPEKTK